MERVIHGHNATPSDAPWQAALCSEKEFMCGGPPITSSWVLTAAHCLHARPGGCVSAKDGSMRCARNQVVMQGLMVMHDQEPGHGDSRPWNSRHCNRDEEGVRGAVIQTGSRLQTAARGRVAGLYLPGKAGQLPNGWSPKKLRCAAHRICARSASPCGTKVPL